MRIVFRVDASNSIGNGHVMRCLTLGDEFVGQGHIVHFICRKLVGNLISTNSAAIENPSIIKESSKLFGSQCIVAAVDVKRSGMTTTVMSHSGTKATDLNIIDWVRQLEDFGAGELIITSVDRDGTMNGYDLDLMQQVTNAVSIPVIASGGAGNFQHMFEALDTGGASAVAAASIFHFTEQTPLEAKTFLATRGLFVRKC